MALFLSFIGGGCQLYFRISVFLFLCVSVTMSLCFRFSVTVSFCVPKRREVSLWPL